MERNKKMTVKSKSDAYAAAGVDITAGYEGVKLMKADVEKTYIPGVIGSIGGFGGLFMPDLAGMAEPILVSGTDGVGTKQRIAQLIGKHDTVGIDCVAMCVNDVVCIGAKPLFFLDYIAIGKNVPEKVAELVRGVSEGCIQAGCALIGGETAEHPGTMAPEDYDLAGFTVGIADRAKLLDNSRMEAGDAVIALPSSGVHSNGFSLVRKVFDIENADLSEKPEELGGKTLGETLLTPTRIYVKPVLKLIEALEHASPDGGQAVKGISHITGGGFYENIPRSIPDGLCAEIMKSQIKPLPIFKLIAERGRISTRDMFNTFNMGVGMSIVVSSDVADKAIEILREAGEDAYWIGYISKNSDEKIRLGYPER